jgi:hypothetical protein
VPLCSCSLLLAKERKFYWRAHYVHPLLMFLCFTTWLVVVGGWWTGRVTVRDLVRRMFEMKRKSVGLRW